MNIEIDKLISEAADFSVGIIALLKQPDLDDYRGSLEELARAVDLRLAKVIELRSDQDAAEHKPKLTPVQ
jgi:hypothetical protein